MAMPNPHLDGTVQEIEAATRWSRLAARLIDYLIWFAPLALFIFPCLGPIAAVLGWLGILGAQIWLLVTRAQTIGKKGMGIYIMRTDGGIPHIGWLLVREFAIPALAGLLQYMGSVNHDAAGLFFSLVASLLWLIDVLFIFGRTRRCLHDYIAGTHVVKAA
ncbi:MAG: RDD family protein [Holophagaceae bacterium]|nr:RDD family protein [Holophagaceae bacterium]